MIIDIDDIGNAYSMIASKIHTCLSQEQGVRLGDSCVVSLKAHETIPKLKGHVKVLTNMDAGQYYLGMQEPGKVVHLSVFHRAGKVDPVNVARQVLLSIEEHLKRLDPRLHYLEGDRFQQSMDLAFKIKIVTGIGQGTVYDLLMGRMEPVDAAEENLPYVRVLIPIDKERYDLIVPIAEGVESAIEDDEEIELARVRRVFSGKGREYQESSKGSYLAIPWRKFKNANPIVFRTNQNQLVMKLVERFGSVEEVREFLDAQSGNLLKRFSREGQSRRWGDIDEHIRELKNLGILKNGLTGPVLTRHGEDVRKFIMTHECELAAELRRNLRRVPKGTGRFHKVVDARQQATKVEFTNLNKVRKASDSMRSGNLAVPETVVRGKISSLMYGDKGLKIRREDLRIYEKRSRVPINICLLIDTSFSMKGEKKQAAFFLAQHLLVSGRDKVAVVTFQDKGARVVVPFTKNHQLLSRNLAKVIPGGMTPMADGIVTSVDLIRSSRLDNPTLILITDGMPNVPLWTYDAEKDALEAARRVQQRKINFICIGVEANKEFLAKVAEAGHGKLYVVDNINRSNLINIVRYEKKRAAIEA